jgi:tetratricopeptide (TPR) repeat protein
MPFMLPSPPSRTQAYIIAGTLAAGTVACALICVSALRTNGGHGFPLDDPWIHLQFARNLRDYGSFSYFANEMVTSGSTSPLYTLILAAGLFLTSNEMVLSYVLGIAFFTAGAFVLSRIGKTLFKNQPVLVVAGIVLFMLEPRLQWGALSGMETSLFILLLLLAWHFYQVRSSRLLGLAAGLLVWTRPDAAIFVAALAIDAAYHSWWVRHQSIRKGSPPAKQADQRWLSVALVIAAVLCAGYLAFNFALSGSLLPNTYAAKTRYYATGHTDFPASVFRFLTGGHMSVLAFLTAIAVVDVLWKSARRRSQEYLVPVLWSVGLFLAYWQKLPFLYQEGRYLMPLLPFVLLLGMRGVELAVAAGKSTLGFLKQRYAGAGVAAVISLLLALQFGTAAWERRMHYADQCKYISDRQVKTALWIRENLPVNAVIGTHDVGALAYYSGRRVVDMVGLVSPDMIENIGNLDLLAKSLGRHRVTHLAVLRNWFEVVNQNPLFQTDERTPEIMEVFAFDPSRSHFIPQSASTLTARGAYFLSTGQVQRAGPLLEESLRIDPHVARTHCYLGLALLTIGKDTLAEREIRTALTLHPDSWQATLALAHLFMKRNDPDQALELYNKVVHDDPACAPVYLELSQFYRAVKKDSATAQEYFDRYTALTRAKPQ